MLGELDDLEARVTSAGRRVDTAKAGFLKAQSEFIAVRKEGDDPTEAREKVLRAIKIVKDSGAALDAADYKMKDAVARISALHLIENAKR